MTDALILTVGGLNYSGWSEMALGRGLDRCVSDFSISVSERWPDSYRPILPFASASVSVGNDVVLTGYVDSYEPSLKADDHSVRISGRSKTQDLVDCSPNVPAGQFAGYTLAAIARALCGIFNVGCVVLTNLADVVIPDATIGPCETAFEFLDRLATVAGAIICDDQFGNLVLTTAGSTKSSTALVQGINLLEVSAGINSTDRFSEYIVKAQAGLAAGIGASGQTTPSGASVQTAQVAVASDASVPRYRPKVFMSESATGQAPIQTQAQWHLNYAIGRSTRAEVTVKGWRQNDGTLWQINQMVSLYAPYIGADDDLLIYSVQYKISATDGRVTTLTLTPVQSAQPSPRLLLQKKGRRGRHGRRGSGVDWSGAGGN